ncbi:MAG TPA: alpha/beta hydrolase [Candidatus Saccharimonadales bacterium]
MSDSKFQKHTLQLNGTGRLVYWERPGRDQTMILLHGFSGDHLGLMELAEALPKDVQIIVPDLPGFGVSDDPSEKAQQSLLAYATCLDGVVDKAAATDKVILLGHSFGCMVAFIYAAKRPEKVSALIGVCPLTTRKVLPRLLGAVGTAAFRHLGFERSKHILAWPPLVDSETYYLLWRLPKARHEAVRNHRRREAAVFRPSTFTMISAADNFRRDAHDLWLSCPALFIVASDDNVAGRTDDAWFRARVNDVSLRYCRGGHLAPVIFPEEIAASILDATLLTTSKKRV